MVWILLGAQWEVRRDIQCLQDQLKAAENIKHPLLCSTAGCSEQNNEGQYIFIRSWINLRCWIHHWRRNCWFQCTLSHIALDCSFFPKTVCSLCSTQVHFPPNSEVIRMNDPFQGSYPSSKCPHFLTLQIADFFGTDESNRLARRSEHSANGFLVWAFSIHTNNCRVTSQLNETVENVGSGLDVL